MAGGAQSDVQYFTYDGNDVVVKAGGETFEHVGELDTR